MTVEPGKGGQKLIPETVEKVRTLKKYIEENNLDTYIEVDGGINKDTVNLVKEAGADIIVAGSAIISAENYLFSCEDLLLHMDSIFICPDTGEVRLAYIPETQNHKSPSFKIASLIQETVQLACDEQWTAYGEEVYDRILSCNESMSGIKKILLDKGREICGNGWPQKSEMRQIAENNKPGHSPA